MLWSSRAQVTVTPDIQSASSLFGPAKRGEAETWQLVFIELAIVSRLTHLCFFLKTNRCCDQYFKAHCSYFGLLADCQAAADMLRIQRATIS